MRMQNSCSGPVMYPVMVTALCAGIIVGMYTGFRLYGNISTAMYLIPVPLAVDGLAVDMLYIRSAGDVDNKSSELLQKWTVLLVYTKFQLKRKRKQLRSCTPLRVKMGSSNFVEILTPLVLLSFCVNQTLTLLIAS
jgi:hypothetical protein